MTQVGYSIELSNRKFEDYPSLKKNMTNYNYVIEHVREIPQVTTNTATVVEEVSGETLTALSSNKTLYIKTAADVAADRDKTAIVKWQDSTGAVSSKTIKTNASNSSTATALSVTTARFIRSVEFEKDLGAEDLFICNSNGAEIYAVIKAGYHQCLKSGFMAQPSPVRSFLGRIKCHLSETTAVVTIAVTFTPAGSTLSTVKSFSTNSIERVWDPCIELAAESEVSITIVDDNAAHPTANLEIIYLEAYDG